MAPKTESDQAVIVKLRRELAEKTEAHRELFETALEQQAQRAQLLELCDGVENAALKLGDARVATISVDQIRQILGAQS